MRLLSLVALSLVCCSWTGNLRTGNAAAGETNAPGPLAAVEALASFTVPEDLEIELVLAEPIVRQPLSMTFDERGRLWVVQYLQYPFPAGLKILGKDKFLR